MPLPSLPLNDALFLAINGLRSPLLDLFMLLGTQLGSLRNLPWILGAAALPAFVCSRARGDTPADARRRAQGRALWRFVEVLLVGCLFTAALVTALKLALDMPRPAVALAPLAVHVLDEPESPYSFPSGHSAFAMLLVLALWPHVRPGIRAALVLFVVWVGLSRISLGVHFPIDVLAGLACGALGAGCASGCLGRLHRRRTGDARPG